MQPAASSTQDAPNAPPQYPTDLMGCLTVFGGVAAGGSWLQDVSLLLLQDDSSAGSSGCCVQSVTVAGSCPVPVCDFAACECGPASFVVVGGFDGSAVTAPLLLQRCVLTRDSLPECSAATTAAADSTASVACSSSAAAAAAAGSSTGVPARGCGIPSTAGQQLSSAAWAAGWQCTWDVLQPRTRSPKGRCHHSCCWHAGSGSLVVFGGYAGGCLSDVQVFNLKHMEWWQPQRAGACKADLLHGWTPWKCACVRSCAYETCDPRDCVRANVVFCNWGGGKGHSCTVAHQKTTPPCALGTVCHPLAQAGSEVGNRLALPSRMMTSNTTCLQHAGQLRQQ